MASRRPNRRAGQLWQLPLLLLSLGLFGYAAYLFIDPKPGPSLADKIDVGRNFLRQERPEAAIGQFNKLLGTERIGRDQEGAVHAMLAEALDLHQRQKKLNVPVYHQRIVEQSRLALNFGAKPGGDFYRRMGESHEALRQPADALSAYRQAMRLDGNRSLRLQRKIIDLQLAADDAAGASISLEEYLSRKELADSERAWAMGESAHLLIDRAKFAEAKKLLGDAAALNVDVADQGQTNYWLGYCAWKLDQADEADRYLRVARDQLKTRHPLDGDAAFVLGQICQDKSDPAQAITFYDVVLTSHPDSRLAPLARLGRGVCRIQSGSDDAGLTDLHDLLNTITQKWAGKPRYKEETVAGLRTAAGRLTTHGNYRGALEVMAYEQTLDPDPGAPFYARLGAIYERRADQIDKSVAAEPKAPEKVRREQQARDARARAGDAYVAYCRALTLADDKGYGDALWKGIDLYDRAGDLQRAISAMELFAAERPEDAQTPDVLLRLGRAYQAAGRFDKAIAAFQKNQFRYAQTLAASKSAVPLAQAYIAKGPEFYAKAEAVLLAVVENNPLVDPSALEFRQSLFELAQLYYRTSRFEQAIGRLEELTQRYQNTERPGQVLFLMADSYRKSANLIEAGGATRPIDKVLNRMARKADELPPARPDGRGVAAPGGALAGSAVPGSAVASADDMVAPVDPIEALAAKRERLAKARGFYDRTINYYHNAPPLDEAGKLFQKLSHYYRADCVYDLGNYEEAIRLYDAAAFRYQDDPSALTAYVQIVNAYCALGKMGEAKTANERAKWLLNRMPADAFAEGGFTMPKAYWDTWLKYTSQSGLWK